VTGITAPAPPGKIDSDNN